MSFFPLKSNLTPAETLFLLPSSGLTSDAEVHSRMCQYTVTTLFDVVTDATEHIHTAVSQELNGTSTEREVISSIFKTHSVMIH